MHAVNRSKFLSMNAISSEFDLRLLTSWKAYVDIPNWLTKTVFVVSFAIGAVRNQFILVYFFRSGKYRIPIFTLFTSLAVTDLLTCLANCAIAQGMYPEVIFPIAAIQLSIMINYSIGVAYRTSVLHLIFLAALRYYQLCYPLKAKVRVTFTWVLRWCIAMWIMVGIINIPVALYRDIRTISYNNRTVKLFVFTGNVVLKNAIESVVMQAIPLFVIAALHFLKLYKMAVMSEVTNRGPRNASSRMAALIIIVYILSIAVRLGHSFVHTVLSVPYQRFHQLLAIVAAGLSSSNSIIDPFIYFFSSTEMLTDIWKTCFRCKTLKGNVSKVV